MRDEVGPRTEMRRILILAVLPALIALISDQALVGTAGGFESGDRWQTRLRLFASQPVPRREARRHGALKVEIPSFGYVGRDGDIFLPTRTVRVAIPEGSGEVRLQGVRGDAQSIRGLKLDPPRKDDSGRSGSVPRPLASALTKGEAVRQRRAVARSEPKEFAPYADPIHLGDVGYFRDQRFVEVIYTPVVSAGEGEDALFYGALDLDIVVEGVAPGSISDEGAAADPLFEDQYRAAFANYDEGRFFRAGSRQIAASSSPSVSAVNAS